MLGKLLDCCIGFIVAQAAINTVSLFDIGNTVVEILFSVGIAICNLLIVIAWMVKTSA